MKNEASNLPHKSLHQNSGENHSHYNHHSAHLPHIQLPNYPQSSQQSLDQWEGSKCTINRPQRPRGRITHSLHLSPPFSAHSLLLAYSPSQPSPRLFKNEQDLHNRTIILRDELPIRRLNQLVNRLHSD